MLAFFSQSGNGFGNPEKKKDFEKEGIGPNQNTLVFLVSMEHVCLFHLYAHLKFHILII